jgi:aspartyl-tRNA(Asn)/glutamyl-tRNA(Gln) amidotransferase subunit C
VRSWLLKSKEDHQRSGSMTENVKASDVERVAELAHLKLSPDEARSMLHDLNAILDYAAQLNELDTSSVAPLSQVIELGGTSTFTSLREDRRKPSLDRGEVMMQAPETDQAFFKVPKVIER